MSPRSQQVPFGYQPKQSTNPKSNQQTNDSSSMRSTKGSFSSSSYGDSLYSVDDKYSVTDERRKSSVGRAVDMAKSKMCRRSSAAEGDEKYSERQQAKDAEKQKRKDEYKRLGLDERVKFGMKGAGSWVA